jgi:hypothetical protein
VSFGVALRNGVSIGLGSIISFANNVTALIFEGYLLAEDGDFLVQENGDKLLLD